MLSVALGADHAGWELKEALKAWLMDAGYQVLDFGTQGPDLVDYPDYALQLAEAVTVGKVERATPAAWTRSPGWSASCPGEGREHEKARAGRSRHRQGHPRRDRAPVAQPRADRLRELRLRGRPRGRRLGDDQQVRGRVSGQALLRRL